MKLQLIINGEKTIIDSTPSDEIIHTSKGESPVTGFIGTISEVEVGPQTTLISFHPCEVKSIEIKNDECPDYILAGAKIRVMWVESITIELI